MLFFKKKPAPLPEDSFRTAQAAPHEIQDDGTVEKITEMCHQAAQGDLEARIIGLSEHPKFGGLARAINSMLDMADSFVRESSAAMLCCSRNEFHRPILLRGLKGAYRASAVLNNRAGAQLKASSDSLALVARLASDNTLAINAVAAACEELHATGGQISRQADGALQLSKSGLNHGEEALNKMEILEAAFRQVDSIVALILGISERTNLLALNASIEATRAGAHGNRFAIIAHEVKELSKNSASATEGIRTQVDLMRQSVEAVSHLLRTIHSSLSATTSSASTIAASIGEQVAATNEIGQQIADLTANSKTVADRVSRC
ncbi:MAG: methyl-accepting chemotaxis protein [Verrucomicrobiae bacterium]